MSSSVTSASSYDRRRRPPSGTPHYMMSTSSSVASVSSRASAGSASSSRISRIPSPRNNTTTSSSRYGQSSISAQKRTVGSRRVRGDNQSGTAGETVDDAAVHDFLNTVSKLGADEWRARTMAFERLLSTLPSQDNETGDALSPRSKEGLTPWYKSPPTLRRLATTITTLLLDPRSTVVKHTCNSLTVLLTSTTDNAGRHLMKDLLPTILALHGQTVNVIKSYALQMMLDILPHTKFKSGLPILLDKLRKDKSRDVREACARYLRAVLVHWGPGSNQPHYLSRDVYVHIGNGLARGLMDPSQCVRAECRSGFDVLRDLRRDIWEDIVHKEDGPLSKDLRLKKTLINTAVRNDAERSLASTEDLQENDDAGSVYSQGSQGSHVTFSSVQSRESHISYGSRSYVSRTSAANRSVATAPTVLGNRSGRYRGSAPAGQQPPRSKTKRHAPSSAIGSKSTIGDEGSVGSRGSRRKSGIVPPSPGVRSKGGHGMSPRQQRHAQSSHNPFAGAMNSPSPETTRNNMISSSSSSARSPPRPPRVMSPPPVSTPAAAISSATPPSQPVNEEIANRAAVAIQAAARGASVRQIILPADDEDYRNNENNDENDRNENQPVTLGKTAKEMAHRRKTIGASKSSIVVPTSGVDSPASYYGGLTSPSPNKIGSGFVSPPSNNGRGKASYEATTPQDIGGGSAAAYTPPPRDAGAGLTPPSRGPNLSARSSNRGSLRRQSSILLQRRLKRASVMSEVTSSGISGISEDSALSAGVDGTPQAAMQPQDGSPKLPESSGVEVQVVSDEHIKIGHQILLAHRTHIDELMETLRTEMDSVGRFEILLASTQQNMNGSEGGGTPAGGGGGGLTEEDVLEYFEAVATCLEQRTENGKRLQETLDRISTGADDEQQQQQQQQQQRIKNEQGKEEEDDDDEDLLVDEI